MISLLEGSAMSTRDEDAGSSGDLAWCLAAYSEGRVAEEGDSLNILEHQADGKWLIRICSLNSNNPQTAEGMARNENPNCHSGGPK
jgi:hypothetical protein